jgi:hypothetical protein
MNLFRSEESAREWPHLDTDTENQILLVTKWVELMNGADIFTKRLEPDFVAKSESWVGEALGKIGAAFG